tara:strand:- start:108 stop:302 length:195 start_codon:yes stop_codon:yes gene_type:complete
MKLTDIYGLGDLIYFVTKNTGIDASWKWFNAKILKKHDCGCQKRRHALNHLLSFRKRKVPTNDD